jgi:hypothetical protein
MSSHVFSLCGAVFQGARDQARSVSGQSQNPVTAAIPTDPPKVTSSN